MSLTPISATLGGAPTPGPPTTPAPAPSGDPETLAMPGAHFHDQLAERGIREVGADHALFHPPMASVVEDARRVPEPGLLGAFRRFDDAFERIQRVQERLVELAGRSRRDPEVRQAEQLLMVEMMEVQVLAQHAQFGVELTSKMVEHGTGGLRTLLQTQA